MANPMMEPLEPYRSPTSDTTEEDYDWDYADERTADRPMNILWGRVGILLGLLLLAFILGRSTAGGGGEPAAAQLQNARDTAAQLESENAQLATDNDLLQSQLDQANAELAALNDAGTSENTDGGAASGDGESAAAEQPPGQTYTVKSGDTLSTIAAKFYDDSSLDDYLAEVNGITDPTALHVGQELLIPDDPPSN